jgi:hypothetical protein
MPPTHGLVVMQQKFTSTWVPILDYETQSHFLMPGQAQRVYGQAGTSSRQYLVNLAGSDTMSVGFVTVSDSGTAQTITKNYASQIRTELKTYGLPKDFAVSDQKLGSYKGVLGSDMRITFTPKGETSSEAVWLVRVLQLGANLMVLQTDVTAPKSQLEAYVSEATSLQNKLVNSVS